MKKYKKLIAFVLALIFVAQASLSALADSPVKATENKSFENRIIVK